MVKASVGVYSRIHPTTEEGLLAYAKEHQMSISEATNRLISIGLQIEALSKALGSSAKVQVVIDVPKL